MLAVLSFGMSIPWTKSKGNFPNGKNGKIVFRKVQIIFRHEGHFPWGS